MKPIVFCNIAYMKYYRGVIKDIDEPVNGGKYVTENNDGGECYNFEPVSFTDGEMMFGYVMPPSNTEKLHIENIIGCATTEAQELSDGTEMLLYTDLVRYCSLTTATNNISIL